MGPVEPDGTVMEATTAKSAGFQRDRLFLLFFWVRHGILVLFVWDAPQIRNLVTVSIHMHLSLDMPFRHSNIRALAVCSEMLKVFSMVLVFRQRHTHSLSVPFPNWTVPVQFF